ncbi:MAG: NAD-dependent DNA ligase LigA, partial [Muribaculaceae bacterium]|nr:NAD-dependent DNA ligase LigA [Muribaculaceae bacterium]
QQRILGFRAISPRWDIAYKFQAERALTRLRFVSFDVGRMGIITPVANLEPVLLSGTIVKRASLHNEDIIHTLGIHEHDMLYVEKGGEIIPKITGVDTDKRTDGAKPVRFITHCPACGARLVRIEGEAAWVCPDKYHCPPQIIGRIEHFVGRRMMDIDGIGAETAKVLYDKGLVRNIADLYDLKADDLENIEGFGRRSAERVIDGIAQSLQVPFDRVLFALSIPYVGETTAKKIARNVRSIDWLMSLSRIDLESIEDVGPRIADSILEFFSTESNIAVIDRLRTAGVRLELPEVEETDKSDKLTGKTIVISGVFSHYSRDQYKDIIERNGGKNSGSISKKTDFVLAGENMGPAKLEKARNLCVPVISEDEFLKMIE